MCKTLLNQPGTMAARFQKPHLSLSRSLTSGADLEDLNRGIIYPNWGISWLNSKGGFYCVHKTPLQGRKEGRDHFWQLWGAARCLVAKDALISALFGREAPELIHGLTALFFDFAERSHCLRTPQGGEPD